jgi:hypothetical protein
MTTTLVGTPDPDDFGLRRVERLSWFARTLADHVSRIEWLIRTARDAHAPGVPGRYRRKLAA